MAGGPNLEGDWFRARHLEDFGTGLEVDPLALHLILIGVVGVYPLYVQVLGVGGLVGQPPRHTLVVADDDPRCASEAETH